MEKLINELIKAGCARERMEIKVFGGGNVTESSNAVGSDNSEFVLRYLEAEGLRYAAKDLGGTLPRRIEYYPSTGRVVRRLLGRSEGFAVDREERDYAKRLVKQRSAGEIELFGDYRMIQPERASSSFDRRRFRRDAAIAVELAFGGSRKFRSSARPVIRISRASVSRRSIPMSSRLTSRCRIWTGSRSCAKS